MSCNANFNNISSGSITIGSLSPQQLADMFNCLGNDEKELLEVLATKEFSGGGGGGGGAFAAGADTLITPVTPIVLNKATGNEVGLTLNYTTNKASFGNDTGLLINKTDTASPGVSALADFQTGGSSKFFVSDGGNVGIGTASPTNLLSVSTSTFSNAFVPIADINYLTYPVMKLGYVGLTGSIRAGVVDTVAYGFAVNTGDGSERLRIDSTGNVGIGTSSPLAAIHSASTGGAPIYLEDSDATSTYSITEINNSAGNLGFNTRSSSGSFVSTDYQIVKTATGADSHRWFSNGAERMRLNSSGNVGIGTTTPTAALQVIGDVHAGAGNVGANSNFIGSGAGTGNTGSNNTGVGTFALDASPSGSHNSGFGYATLTTNGTGVGNTASGYAALSSNTSGSYNSATGYSSLFNNLEGVQNVTSGYVSLYSNTSGSYNAAIGTGALYANITGSYNSAIGYLAGRFQADGTTALTDAGTSVFVGANSRGVAAGANQISIGYNAIGLGANTVVLGNDSIVTTALKGNVGIGTTTPNSPLEISKSAAGANVDLLTLDNPSATVGSATKILLRSTASTVRNAYIQAINTSSSGAPQDLAFGTNAAFSDGTEKMRIDSSGNVGIGTTSPGNKLTVNADGGGGAITYLNNTNVSGYGLLVNSADTNNARYALKLTSGSGTLMFVGNGGNVGIGTTTPNANALLDITSTTKAFLPPRMTTTQKNAVASPTAGMVVYDSTLSKLAVYTGAAWEAVTSA